MEKKANIFRHIYILFTIFYSTLTISIKTLFYALVSTVKRSQADRWLQWWINKILKATKVNVTVVKNNNFTITEDRAYIIMSNHLSHYDIPILYKAMPEYSIRMITKKELFKVPIWGRAMKAAGFVSIDRQNKRQAFKDLMYAKERMEDGIKIWVAPEGSRSTKGTLLPFKSGGFKLAQATKAIIIPVGIRNSDKILPPKDKLRFKINVDVEVHIGKPIDTLDFKKEKDVKVLISAVKDEITKLVGY